MIRSLASLSLLLLVSGCASTDAPHSAQASPTAPSDLAAASACRLVADAIEKQDLGFGAGTRPGARAVKSVDPGVQEAGRELVVVGMEAERLWVKNDPTVDRGPADARVAEAQQKLLSACTDLFGPQPWPFDKRPSPTATR
ncbi:hypothetical protein [Micromonospora sp. NPDC049240]|uniref:hypothetical protein n=1 Tax=Micromonospora sp. NPDC049240 TaxID=3155151 RepID=UPI0033DF46F1